MLAATLALALVAGAAVVVGIGPFARGAAPSAVFVAISRSEDENDAREIEVVDLETGTHTLFELDERIAALALAPDRRSLYVALERGSVAFLDAGTGTRFATVDVHGRARSLIASPDGRALYVMTETGANAWLVVIDLGERRAAAPFLIGSRPQDAGRPALRGDTLLVPFADPLGLQILTVGLSPVAVLSQTSVPQAAAGSPVAVPLRDGRTAVAAFDAGGISGIGTHVYVFADPAQRAVTELRIPAGFAQRSSLQAAAASDGTLHVCALGGPQIRYTIASADLIVTPRGNECGPMAGGDQILLGRRAPAQLLVLDGSSGRVVRSLPLAGVPAFVAR